jgi:glycyl-tRNA synthetase (class II)
MFSDERTFHLSGHVDPHKDRILGNTNITRQNPQFQLRLYFQICAQFLRNKNFCVNKCCQMFSDERTFHLSGHVDPHKDRILGNTNPHTVVERTEECLKVYVLCAL